MGHLRKSGDATADDYSDQVVGKYGLKATTRFGLGILRSNAIAKMTNIKTTMEIVLWGGRYLYSKCIQLMM